jgi:endonuclease/exonuclease/phosphatase family metal-dependent hydrolase
MAIEVFSQNARDGFSDEKRAHQLIDRVEELNPSVAVFPEAYTQGEEGLLDYVQEDLEDLGYLVTLGHYDDADGRSDRHGILAVVKESLAVPNKPGRLVRTAGRNAVEAWLVDPETELEAHFQGVHLDDREESTRMAQARTLRGDILAGDFNAMHRESTNNPKIKVGHAIAALTRVGIMPKTTPKSIEEKFSLGKIGSLGYRLHGMALGTTMENLGTRYKDADEDHQPTMPASKPFAQLDHILVRPRYDVTDFAVLAHDGSSDHRGIMARVVVR